MCRTLPVLGRLILTGAILGLSVILSSCQQESPVTRESWTPAMEQTGFEYLDQAAQRILQSVREGKTALSTDRRAADAHLAEAEDSVRVLLFYDLPITEARQLIYDAARLHEQVRHQDAIQHLDKANLTLDRINRHASANVRKPVVDLQAKIVALRTVIEKEQQAISAQRQAEISIDVSRKFQALGHSVNMMALKSDMVLSGADFSSGDKD